MNAHRSSFLSTACLLCVSVAGTIRTTSAANYPLTTFRGEIKPLLQTHCLKCHGRDLEEGNLRLDQLDPDIVNGKDADFWHEVLNQLNEGRMPPSDEPPLSADELRKLTTWLESQLHEAAARRRSSGGRQLMRRMSRYEYQYTLEDLLGIALDYSARVPGDLTGEDGLQNNATRLGMSLVQMQSYLDVAELALKEAIPDGPEKVFRESIDQFQVVKLRRQKGGKVPKGVKPKFIAPTPGLDNSNFVHDLPRKVTFDERPFAGRFRIRVKVIATAASDGRRPELMIQVGHRASGDYDPKKIMGAKMLEASEDPQIVEFVGNIEDFPLGRQGAYYNGSGSHNVTHLSVWIWNTAAPQSEISAKTAIESIDEPLLEPISVEFEAPLLEGYPSEKARQLIPSSLDLTDETEAARTVLQSFLRRAYRRDVSESEVTHAVESFQTFRKLTPTFRSAIRKTMAMALVSPKFIYLIEPSGLNDSARRLNGFELATRLSYFLWASMPDDELLDLAASGELLKPAVLRTQVSRMQKEAKFERFAKQFSGQWLGLSSLDHVAVNPSVHPEFSDAIRENLKEETLEFASYVFVNNFDCRNFIRSDFAMLNQQLAAHYGIDGVHGSHFRPVQLSEDDHRGGVLTQGSVMILGSDGTDSNPIYRGVWLRKRLFADPPPPPPPGAPPLDKSNPQLSRLTLKQQIELHRKADACARCHSEIDPWGIAFENYSATGRWRATIRTGNDRKTTIPVDASTTLPDGHHVSGVQELQNYLVEHKSHELALALVRRMSAYALGRDLEFSDDDMVENLAERFEKGGFRASTLIDGIVTSDAFLTK